ncbi:MAG: BadF/BadG/BcrA/BcrD ATPase family protein [Bacteroidota bacterium]
MLAIIDGGSTKADWRINDHNGSCISFTSTGFNPNYDSKERIVKLLSTEIDGSFDKGGSMEIHYYGAGCWDIGRKSIVRQAFATVFPNAAIFIDHDLLAAARATCGNQPGISCILGTGSNSVLFDGDKEVDNVTNLGFLLGDEGSGSMIGRRLVQAYFYREMPTDLQPIMKRECPNGKLDILDEVYGGGVPAAFLASFTKKFFSHRNHPFVWGIIKECFDEFLKRHVFKYENYRNLPIHFVGSVAFHYHEILKELMNEHQLNLGVILKKPIESLFNFHLRQGASSSS